MTTPKTTPARTRRILSTLPTAEGHTLDLLRCMARLQELAGENPGDGRLHGMHRMLEGAAAALDQFAAAIEDVRQAARATCADDPGASWSRRGGRAAQ